MSARRTLSLVGAWALFCLCLLPGGCAEVGGGYPDLGASVSDEDSGTVTGNQPPVDTAAGPSDVSADNQEDAASSEDSELPPEQEDSDEIADSAEDTGEPDLPPFFDTNGPSDTDDAVEDECDDDNVCTEDFVDEDGDCVNKYVYGICCTADPMCNDDDPCTSDICVAGLCTHASSCCTSDDECQDGESLCTVDTCTEGECLHTPTGAAECCTPGLFLVDENFDGELTADFVIENTAASVGWHVTTNSLSESPPGALWYGNSATQNYDTGTVNSGTVTLPVLSLPPGVDVGMIWDLYLDVQAGTYYDKFEVHLFVDGSTEPVVVWNKSKAIYYKKWFKAAVNLNAFAGRDVQIQFVFDTVNDLSNTGQGIFLDNLRLGSINCTAPTCVTAMDCNDLLGATIDLCVGGFCTHKPNSNYCTSSTDCDDGVPCTANSCSQNQCVYPELSNCCLSNDECSDNNLCTLDDCVGAFSTNGGYCKYTAIPDCCLSDSQCNDGDICTIDDCPGVGEICTHDPVPGCCTAHEDCVDSDPCTEDLCVSGQCQSQVVCCASDAACNDGDDLCTSEACVEGVCQFTFVNEPGCCKVSILTDAFTGPTFGSFQEISDDTPGDGVTWSVVGAPAFSPNGSLHYGSVAGTYETGFANSASILSNTFELPATTISRLQFWLFLDNEYANGAGSIQWDRLTIHAVRMDDSGEELLLWDSAWGTPSYWFEIGGVPDGAQWTFVDGLDMTPFKGRDVRLRIRFDTVDSDANAFEGVYLDDIEVISTCGP